MQPPPLSMHRKTRNHESRLQRPSRSTVASCNMYRKQKHTGNLWPLARNLLEPLGANHLLDLLKPDGVWLSTAPIAGSCKPNLGHPP